MDAVKPTHVRPMPAYTVLDPVIQRCEPWPLKCVTGSVRKVDEPRSRKGKQASPEGWRWGRPPKRREQDAAEIASLQDLAARER